MRTSVSAPRTHFNTKRGGKERRLPELERKMSDRRVEGGDGKLWRKRK